MRRVLWGALGLVWCILVTFAGFTQEIVLQDDWGREVKLSAPLRRIISLSPSNTEIVFALGMEEFLVGVTSYCNYPPQTQKIEKVGNVTEVDVERVVALNPEVVLAGSLTPPEVVERLEKLGIPVFVLDPHNIEEVLEDIDKVAIIGGVEKRGQEMVQAMRAKIQAITDRISSLSEEEKPRVLHVLWHDPIWTAGKGTFIDEFIVKAGGVNAVSDLTGYVILDLEEVFRRNPEIITVVTSHGAEKVSYEFFLTDERLKVLRAVEAGKVFMVDSDLVSRPGPRVVEALSLFAQIVHPEIFDVYVPPQEE